MITQEQIARINELAHKSKAEGLNEVEKEEQLENTYIVDEKGNKRKVTRKGKCEN